MLTERQSFLRFRTIRHSRGAPLFDPSRIVAQLRLSEIAYLEAFAPATTLSSRRTRLDSRASFRLCGLRSVARYCG